MYVKLREQGGEWGQGIDETSLITNNFKKSLKHRESDSQGMREGKIIRDILKLTETQTNKKRERERERA